LTGGASRKEARSCPNRSSPGRTAWCVKKAHLLRALIPRPEKTLSTVLLPWREEEVEEGEQSPLTSFLSHEGERKIKVQGSYRPALLRISAALHLGIFEIP